MLNQSLFIIRCLVILSAVLLCVTVAYAGNIQNLEMHILEAGQFRAAEFSPQHYMQAKDSLQYAQKQLALGHSEKAQKALQHGDAELVLAMDVAQQVSQKFSRLLESRDRMQMTDKKYLRDDLVARAEQDFQRVIIAVENNHISKAKKLAGIALNTMHLAQLVASREQFVHPISKAVAAGRKVHARHYAPLAFNAAIKAQKRVEKMIKNDPDAQVKMYALTKQGETLAKHSVNIAMLGLDMKKNPAKIEFMVGAEEARLLSLGKLLGIDLSKVQGFEQQVLLLQQGIGNMEETYQLQLQESDKMIANLNGKLGVYEGDLASMGELRRKLQLKRDAETKIKRLTKLFSPADVEILLTPNADVILRMKKLNFRSGSSVIPPSTYAMLDAASESILMFPKRSIRVEGHTDAVGSNIYNQDLSERRSVAVKSYLTERLTDAHMIESVGLGEEKPIANNETAQGREKNRRIDIVLLAPQV